MKYKIGEEVKFSWYDGKILDGKILDAKTRFLREPIYRVMYGVGAFGIKSSDCEEWVKESNIFSRELIMGGV